MKKERSEIMMRLPVSTKKEIERLAKKAGLSVNAFLIGLVNDHLKDAKK